MSDKYSYDSVSSIIINMDDPRRDEILAKLAAGDVEVGVEVEKRDRASLRADYWKEIYASVTTVWPRLPTPCSRLQSLCALVPGTRLRNRVLKLVADEQAHALDLQKQSRLRAARWISLCAWVHVIVLVFRAPLAAVVDLVKKGSTPSAE